MTESGNLKDRVRKITITRIKRKDRPDEESTSPDFVMRKAAWCGALPMRYVRWNGCGSKDPPVSDGAPAALLWREPGESEQAWVPGVAHRCVLEDWTQLLCSLAFCSTIVNIVGSFLVVVQCKANEPEMLGEIVEIV